MAEGGLAQDGAEGRLVGCTSGQSSNPAPPGLNFSLAGSGSAGLRLPRLEPPTGRVSNLKSARHSWEKPSAHAMRQQGAHLTSRGRTWAGGQM